MENLEGNCYSCTDFDGDGKCQSCTFEGGCNNCGSNVKVWKNEKGKNMCSRCLNDDSMLMSDRSCQGCHLKEIRECTSCSDRQSPEDPIKCTSCKEGYQLLAREVTSLDQVQCIKPPQDNTCYDSRLPQPYVKCSKIDINCVKCFKNACQRYANDYYRCQECQDGYKVSKTIDRKFECEKHCPVGTALIPEKNTCFKCSDYPNCLQCRHQAKKGSVECIQCARGYLVADPSKHGFRCVIKCNSNSIRMNDNTCASCKSLVPNCRRCQKMGQTICTECEERHILSKEVLAWMMGEINRIGGVQCIRQCDVGFALNMNNECVRCQDKIEGCSECKHESGLVCTKCLKGFMTEDQARIKGIENLPAGRKCYRDCKPNQALRADNTCVDCRSLDVHCTKCLGGAKLTCQECQKGFVRRDKFLKNNQDSYFPPGFICLRDCPRGYRLAKANGCAKCPANPEFKGNCVECKMSAEYKLLCLQCPEGYHLNRTHRCQKSCEEGQVWISPNDCSECSQNCLECKNLTKICSKCEEGYKINSNEPTECQIVYEGKIRVTSSSYDNLRSVAMIHLNTSITEKEYNEIFKTSVFYSQNDTEISDFNSVIKRLNNKKGFEIELNFEKKEFSGYMKLTNTSKMNIEATGDNKVYYEEDTIRVNNISFFRDSTLKALASAQKPVKVSAQSMNAVFLISNPGVGVLFLRMMQTFKIYRFVNVTLPANAKAVFAMFDTSLLDLFPDLLKTQEPGLGCQSIDKLIEDNIDCVIMNNGGTVFLVQPLGYILLKLASMVLIWVGKGNKKGKVHTIGETLSKKLNNLFFLQSFRAMQMGLLTALSINMFYLNTSGAVYIQNSVISLTVLVAYYIFALMALINSFGLEQFFDKKEGVYKNVSCSFKMWIFLKIELREELSGLGRHFTLIYLLKDFVIATSIIEFTGTTPVQIVVPILYGIFTAVVILVYRPLKDDKENWTNLSATITELLMMLVFRLMYLTESKSEKFRYLVVGNIMVGLMLLIFLGYSLYGLVSTIKKIIGYFNKKSENERKLAKSSQPNKKKSVRNF